MILVNQLVWYGIAAESLAQGKTWALKWFYWDLWLVWLQLVWSNSARNLVWKVTGKRTEKSRASSTAALCVEDDLWDLSILHRSAVVIPSRVAERKAGFGSCCWWFMDHFAQSFGSIVGIWTLQWLQKTRRTDQDRDRSPAGPCSPGTLHPKQWTLEVSALPISFCFFRYFEQSSHCYQSLTLHLTRSQQFNNNFFKLVQTGSVLQAYRADSLSVCTKKKIPSPHHTYSLLITVHLITVHLLEKLKTNSECWWSVCTLYHQVKVSKGSLQN